MRFRFTHHGNYRIFLERHISAADIRTVINAPEATQALPDGAVKCVRRLDKGVLVVIYSRHRDVYTIITAYFK